MREDKRKELRYHDESDLNCLRARILSLNNYLNRFIRINNASLIV